MFLMSSSEDETSVKLIIIIINYVRNAKIGRFGPTM